MVSLAETLKVLPNALPYAIALRRALVCIEYLLAFLCESAIYCGASRCHEADPCRVGHTSEADSTAFFASLHYTYKHVLLSVVAKTELGAYSDISGMFHDVASMMRESDEHRRQMGAWRDSTLS